MRKLATLAFTALIVVSMLSVAVAQESRDAGIFFDDGMGGTTATSRDIPAFQPTVNAFVIGFDMGPSAGWEAALTIGDPGWNMGVALVPSSSLNAGQNENYIVGFGECIDDGASQVIASIGLGWYQGAPVPQDELLCMSASSPSSFNPPVPGYSSCSDELIPFGAALNGGGNYPDGCALINGNTQEDPIPNDAASWGAVKADF